MRNVSRSFFEIPYFGKEFFEWGGGGCRVETSWIKRHLLNFRFSIALISPTDQSEMYLNAIEKAVQYIRSNIDQDYCLQVDSNCYPGSSVLTHRGPAASKTVLTEQTSESNHQEDAARSRLSNGNCNGKTCDEKQLITEDKPEQPIIVNFSQARKSSVPVRPVRPVKRKRERKRKEDSSTPCSAEVIETDLTPTNPKKLKTESPLVEDLKQDSCTPSPILSAWLSSTPVSHLTTMIDSGDDLEVNSESDSDDDLPVVDLSMKETVGRQLL